MRGLNLDRIIEMGRRTGYITQGLVAFWTGRAGYTAYLVFKQIKELCEDGVLNTDTEICMVKGNKLVFQHLNGNTKDRGEQEFMEYVNALKSGEYEVVE